MIERGRNAVKTPSDVSTVTTTCAYCGVGCKLELHVRDNRVVGVTSPADSVVNRGNLCVKGRFGYDFLYHPDRLKLPLVRKHGELVEVEWDEALDYAAHKLAGIRDRYGSDALAGFSSAKCTNEENYLFQKWVRACMGTNNIDHCARLCHASSVVAMQKAIGSAAMSNNIRGISACDCMIVVGSNTTENHPIVALEMKRAVHHGAKLILMDPRRIGLADFAELWLRQEPGTDLALLNGLIHVIIKEELYNAEFVARRTEGFNALARSIELFTPEYVERVTSVPAADLRRAARMYAQAERGAIFWGMGISQHVHGTANAQALVNLALLTGHIGKEGTGLNPLRGQNNVQGAGDMGALPNVYPGYQDVEDDGVRARFEKAWGVSLSPRRGWTSTELIPRMESGEVRGLYIMGENPLLTDPNLSHARHCFEQLDFLAVQDIFLNETAELADVVFPAAAFAEKDGTFTNTERRVQRVRRALGAPGYARPDWQIICDLSTRMGYPMAYDSPAEIMDEIASVTPGYAGISYNRIDHEGLQWPVHGSDHPGTSYLHRQRFPSGRGRLIPTAMEGPDETVDDEYPLVLTTGRVLYHWHGGVMTRRSSLTRAYPEGLVEINPADAGQLGIEHGQLVRVTSRRGEVTAKAQVTSRSPEGAVFMTFHFAESATNLLTNDALDPEAKIPEYKLCAVRLVALPGDQQPASDN